MSPGPILRHQEGAKEHIPVSLRSEHVIIFAVAARGRIFICSLKQREWIKEPKERQIDYRSSLDERSLTQYSNRSDARQRSGVWHLCLYCGGEYRSRFINLVL